MILMYVYLTNTFTLVYFTTYLLDIVRSRALYAHYQLRSHHKRHRHHPCYQLQFSVYVHSPLHAILCQ